MMDKKIQEASREHMEDRWSKNIKMLPRAIVKKWKGGNKKTRGEGMKKTRTVAPKLVEVEVRQRNERGAEQVARTMVVRGGGGGGMRDEAV